MTNQKASRLDYDVLRALTISYQVNFGQVKI